MFTESAEIYDLIYSFKDYEKESAEIASMIRSVRPDCKSILDVGCGTSEHHKHLKEHFTIDGIDLNLIFIETSKQKNPGGNYCVANMINFDVRKQYDVILCLFSSIGYLQNTAEIQSALKCFHKHLKSDGLLIVEPWFMKENWTPGKVHMITNEKDDLKVCRMSSSEQLGEFSILKFNYLIGSVISGIRQFKEEHKLRMTSKEEMLEAFRNSGFEVNFDEKGLTGRGLYYGVKKL